MKYNSTEGMKIFEPISVKGMNLKNRIGIAPYGSHPCDPDGAPNDATVGYYKYLAESGAGFIQIGIVDPIPKDTKIRYNPRSRIRFSEDSMIDAWRRVTDVIHEYGCKCSIQLGIFGYMQGNRFSELIEDNKKYAFSHIDAAMPVTKHEEANLMTPEEIMTIVGYCGDAARRAVAAGFDSVEVHNAHSDVMFGACSLDPMFNTREDEFGGTIEGRLRFTVEMVKEMKRNVPDGYPVALRINADDLKGELANTNEDICKYIVPALEAAGVDLIDCSAGGSLYAGHGNLPTLYQPRACWIHLHANVKKAATVPVIGVGRITSLEMGEKIIREGLVDILFFGREAYVDNEWIRKFQAGKNMPGEVRQCIGCDTRCFPCSMNYAAIGLQRPDMVMPLVPAAKKKRVLVIGGGVGGMEAARVAAGRGHEVTLWEKKSVLGGAVGVLATTPHLFEFKNAVEYLSGQMAELGVDVRVCCDATIDRVKAFAPDAVILATGTTERLPEAFEGQPMVMSLLEAMERRREFRSVADWHKKIWFSGFTGCEFALDLVAEGAEVTMVGPGGDKTVAAEKWFTRDRKDYLRHKLTDANYVRRDISFSRANVKMLFHSKITSVDAQGVHYYHNGINKVSPYDAVIITSPRDKNDEMFEKLQELVPEVYKIGDCDKVGIIQDAVRTANEVARTL